METPQVQQLVNEVDAWGVAIPTEAYPNPVRIPRIVYTPIRALATLLFSETGYSGTQKMHEHRVVCQLLDGGPIVGDFKPAIEWLVKNEKEWLRGIGMEKVPVSEGDADNAYDGYDEDTERIAKFIPSDEFPAGFEITRYRISLDYSDGTQTVLREDEDRVAIVRYADELKLAYQARQYLIRAREDKGIGICRTVRNPIDGSMVVKEFCVLRVKAISARHHAPLSGTDSVRYPNEADVKRLEAADATL